MKALEIIKNHLDSEYGTPKAYPEELKQAIKNLKPPTADKVCKALSEACSEHFRTKMKVTFNHNSFYYDRAGAGAPSIPQVLVHFYDGKIVFGTDMPMLPPHLITMIGRFYESWEANYERN